MPSPRLIWRTAPIQHFQFKYLVIVPILLAIATFAALFVHSDVDVALLWSQCHARERIPALSRIPLLGTPSCFLVSFFQAALDSMRTKAVMAVILAYVGALATVCNVEAARRCNQPNVVIKRPLGPWLLFNLLGGAVVWQVLIVPSFILRAKELFTAQKASAAGREGNEASSPSETEVELAGEAGRTLPDSEVVAIPIAVAVGYVLPSAFMLIYNTPAAITIWLFFPLYISLTRKAVRSIIQKVRDVSPANIHFETHWQAVALVYALPILLSILAHVFVIWNMTLADDRKKMTKLTVRFIEIDFQFIAWTVLYWVFVEAGLRVPILMLCTALLFGPGAGTCFGWLYREILLRHGFGDVDDIEGVEGENENDEERPLLQ